MSVPGTPATQEELVSNTNTLIPDADEVADDAAGPPRRKDRKRFLHSLQRMSSSQSLLRLKRTPSSTGYRGTGKGSVSCISLSSSSTSYNNTLGSSYGSQLSQGFSTAPTSIPSTPGGETPLGEDGRIRFIREGKSTGLRTPLSVGLPSDIKATRPLTSAGPLIVEEDYFSCESVLEKPETATSGFDFWYNMPSELKSSILRFLDPREIIRCSRVSKAWNEMCFDGHLWADLDATPFYQKIPAEALVKIITNAGPFARDLNLRGCVQLWDHWRETSLAGACSNLQYLSLQDCRIDRPALHSLLYQNCRLAQINLSGLAVVTNTSLKIIAQQCPRLEHLNVSWCCNIDTRGLRHIVENCPNLRDLRAGEVRGFGDVDFMHELFKRNTLERLVLMNCETLSEESFSVLLQGIDPEKDYLTGRAIVPPRKLKHLDVARCKSLGDDGVLALVANTPEMEGLQLSKCHSITDNSLTQLLPTLPKLTHLDLEELDLLTNATLQEIAKAPCSSTLQHLSISYCENLGDVGMLPVIKGCTVLRNLELDNTRISDLVLIEAAAAVRARPTVPNVVRHGRPVPEIGLSMVVYDCQNVTWTGIREILTRNTEPCNSRGYPLPPPPQETTPSSSESSLSSALSAQQTWSSNPALEVRVRTPASATQQVYPGQIISLKVFYGYQPTVTEHMRRCMRGDFPAAARLERKWAEYMVASEEAGAPGGFGPGGFGLFTGVAGRRRRRRIREAAMMHADEEDEGGVGVGVGRRRRARSGGGCAVM